MLTVDHLSRTYTSGSRSLEVLRDISFIVPEGGSLSIVGPSGSGKTTLLGLCAGLDHPTSGTVSLNGVLLNELTENERAELRRDQVGFIFQNFQLIPTLTALENVMVPMELAGKGKVAEEAAHWLERVGLSDRERHYPGELSGGEQQRVSIARAFAGSPAILFADEPTGNLDEETGQTIEDLLFDLNREKGTALVLVTHDHDLADRTQRILRLRKGIVVEEGEEKGGTAQQEA